MNKAIWEWDCAAYTWFCRCHVLCLLSLCVSVLQPHAEGLLNLRTHVRRSCGHIQNLFTSRKQLNTLVLFLVVTGSSMPALCQVLY